MVWVTVNVSPMSIMMINAVFCSKKVVNAELTISGMKKAHEIRKLWNSELPVDCQLEQDKENRSYGEEQVRYRHQEGYFPPDDWDNHDEERNQQNQAVHIVFNP